MKLLKRVYVIKFYDKGTKEKGCATVRGRRDAHDMLIEFNKLYTGLTATDIKRIK